MFKWLKSIFEKIGDSKFWKFLKEVFAGKTGEFLDLNYEIINRNVQEVEKIAEYIIENRTTQFVELEQEIFDKFNFKVDAEDIVLIDEDKSFGKFSLAYKSSLIEIKKENSDFLEKTFKSALRLGIELAVSRFFGK